MVKNNNDNYNIDNTYDNIINGLDTSNLFNNNCQIYSLNDELSPLEIILNNLFNIECVIFFLSVVIINIFFWRLILWTYKNYLISLTNSWKLQKINVKKIIDNILIINFKFYNVIIIINMFSITFFSLYIMFIFY